MSDPLLLALAVVAIIFFASFTQSVVGFGTAMVGMPLMVGVLGIAISAPLVAMVGLTLEVVMVLNYRQSVSLAVMWRLIAAAVVGIPLGIYAVRRIDEETVLTVLGVVIAGYAIYGLLRLRLPESCAANYGPTARAFCPASSAAPTTQPARRAVIYGHCKRWPPEEFA